MTPTSVSEGLSTIRARGRWRRHLQAIRRSPLEAFQLMVTFVGIPVELFAEGKHRHPAGKASPELPVVTKFQRWRGARARTIRRGAHAPVIGGAVRKPGDRG
jgi:hypothetical protein